MNSWLPSTDQFWKIGLVVLGAIYVKNNFPQIKSIVDGA